MRVPGSEMLQCRIGSGHLSFRLQVEVTNQWAEQFALFAVSSCGRVQYALEHFLKFHCLPLSNL